LSIDALIASLGLASGLRSLAIFASVDGAAAGAALAGVTAAVAAASLAGAAAGLHAASTHVASRKQVKLRL
jgi:hypothetical protein